MLNGCYLRIKLLIFFIVLTNINLSHANDHHNEDYLDLSLQDLLSIEVTSVSKTEQSLRDVATAIHVITSEDIQRSGATTIPDLLRTVPGMNVGQVSSTSWAVSTRGFNDVRARKLLILVDGRSIYSPFYGGVFWNAQDIPLYDVERIEIIRGPGGTIWGANAVNGVINIMTRNAEESQGTILSTRISDTNTIIKNMRFGGQLNETSYYRVYAKVRNTGDTTYGDKTSNTYSRLDGFELISDPSKDEAKFIQTGFRIDHQKDVMNTFTLQGDIYRGQNDSYSEVAIPTAPFKEKITQENLSGGNLLGRWHHDLENDASLMLQVYLDKNKTDIDLFSYEHTTFDIEFQYQIKTEKAHSLIWGAGYRGTKDNVKSAFFLHVTPETRKDDVFNAFIQNEMNLKALNSKVTVGSKIEHNDYTGMEVQPSARFVWTPSESFSFWGAVSRAIHTPTRFDHDGGVDIHLPYTENPSPMTISIKKSPALKSEVLIAHEAGARAQLSNVLSLDLALFHNSYENLRGRLSDAPDFTSSPGTMIIPSTRVNNMSGTSIGGELAITWQAKEWWKIQGNYSYLRMRLDSEENDQSDEDLAKRSPSHQFNVISNMVFLQKFDLNLTSRYVSQIKSHDRNRGVITQTYDVPKYLEFDARIDWQVEKSIKLSLIGRNLRNKLHWEFPKTSAARSQQIRRSISAEVRLDF